MFINESKNTQTDDVEVVPFKEDISKLSMNGVSEALGDVTVKLAETHAELAESYLKAAILEHHSIMNEDTMLYEETKEGLGSKIKETIKAILGWIKDKVMELIGRMKKLFGVVANFFNRKKQQVDATSPGTEFEGKTNPLREKSFISDFKRAFQQRVVNPAIGKFSQDPEKLDKIVREELSRLLDIKIKEIKDYTKLATDIEGAIKEGTQKLENLHSQSEPDKKEVDKLSKEVKELNKLLQLVHRTINAQQKAASSAKVNKEDKKDNTTDDKKASESTNILDRFTI